MEKNILIIGANSDIVKELIKIFINNNYHLYLLTRDKIKLKNYLENLIIKKNYNIIEFDPKNYIDLPTILDSLKPVPTTSIIANGYMGDKSDLSENPANIKKIIDINFTYSAIISEMILNIYKKKNNSAGNLIVLSSIAGERGRAKNYIYGSAKSGITNYFSGLRQKYNSTNIIITTIILGFVKTKMTLNDDMSPFLTSTPKKIAKSIYKSIIKKNDIYFPLIWRIIGLIIKFLPEKIFKKLKF
jgi:decaprenylphospho-beta-D-erythro-pentofuranosid-2-ulose 2-reductase